MPLAVTATKGAITLTFSEAVGNPDCSMKMWSLKRSAKYGSGHHDEREVQIRGVKASADGRTLTLDIPDLAPTHCYELKIGDRVLHGTIHSLR